MHSTDSSKQMDSFPKNHPKPRRDVPHEVVSINFDQMKNVQVQGTKCRSELQDNWDREKERDSFARNKPKHQGDQLDRPKPVSFYQTENKAEDTEYGSEICDVESTVCSKKGDAICKRKLKCQENALEEVEPINTYQTGCNKPQGTDQCLEMQDSINGEKERESFPKQKFKPQGTVSEVKSTDINQTEGGEPQRMGHGLKLQHGTVREKKRKSFTENKSKPQGDASDEVKMDIAKQKNSEIEKKISEKDVKHKLNVDENNHTLAALCASVKRVKYKEKHARIQVLSLGNSLEAYLPSLKNMILDRKYRHSDLICKLDELKQYIPTDATYCKCIFLIDLDEQTGKPILGIFTDGKVQKNWEGRQFYHPSILEVAEVFEKLISASEWEVVRGHKRFWRKLYICCNKSGELVLWLLVQSPKEKAREVIQKLKTLFTEFFEKGQEKKYKIASVYTQITFSSIPGSPDPTSSSLTELIIGSEQYEDCILGFKLRMITKIPMIWGMEQSCMMCEVLKDLLALDDYTTVIIIGLTDCGLLALTLAKDAGEVICVDRVPIIEDVKQNIRLNNLESKCKFYAGFAIEEVRKIIPRYKKVYAVVTVPTVARVMAFKEHENLSCVRSVVIFLQSSNISSASLMALCDTERGMSFFPSRIIPFDTHPDDKDYMMAICTEKVDVSKAGTGDQSSSRRSSGRVWPQDHRGRDDRAWCSKDHSAAERRERNRMLPDAREVIVARRHNKQKEQLMLTSKFRSHEHPNLVIEVKEPNCDNHEQRRYVKERTKEADEYRHKIIEEGDMCTKARQRVQDVLTDSLKRHLPNIDENIAEKLKGIMTEAIVCAGLFNSPHQRNKQSFILPGVTDYELEDYLKYHLSDDSEQSYGIHISHFDDGIRENEITECGYVNGSFQRQHKGDNCDKISSFRTSDDYPNNGRKAVQKRELLSDGRSVQIDTRETFDMIGTCVHQNIDRADNYNEVEAFRFRKRALEIDHSVNQHSEKRRSQDPYEDRYASSLSSSSSLEVTPYCSTQPPTTTFSQYVVSEDKKHNRNPTETLSYVTVQNRNRRDIRNPVTQIPFNTKDLRYAAEKHSMLPQMSFGVFPSGGTAHLGSRPGFQHMYKHPLSQSTLTNAVHTITSVQGNMDVSKLPNIEFKRPPPYCRFMPPHLRNK